MLQGSGTHQHLSSAGASARSNAHGSSETREALDNVGLVVWQSAFVLAELLMSDPPYGSWHDVRVVDLGTGTGNVPVASPTLLPFHMSGTVTWG